MKTALATEFFLTVCAPKLNATPDHSSHKIATRKGSCQEKALSFVEILVYCIVMSTKTVFVGDLSFFCEESHLLTLFTPLGNVVDIDLKRGPDGESLLHAFVKFENELSVHISIEVLNGVKFLGRKLMYGIVSQSPLC